jgi:hypothetical protein
MDGRYSVDQALTRKLRKQQRLVVPIVLFLQDILSFQSTHHGPYVTLRAIADVNARDAALILDVCHAHTKHTLSNSRWALSHNEELRRASSNDGSGTSLHAMPEMTMKHVRATARVKIALYARDDSLQMAMSRRNKRNGGGGGGVGAAPTHKICNKIWTTSKANCQSLQADSDSGLWSDHLC